MANFYRKRPKISAVRLIPENVEEIRELTSCEVMAFFDHSCFIEIESKITRYLIGDWLVLDESKKLSIVPAFIFNRDFELAP